MSTTTRRRPTQRRTFTMSQVEEASGLQAGFCIACGAMQEECEPDAREYKCDDCGADKVFGAEEIMLMGLVT